MIDIHCHIIPGVDDGAPDMRTSLDMAVIAAGDGIRTIVATPHIQSDTLTPGFIREQVDILNDKFSGIGIPVTVVPGGEVASFLPVSMMKNYSINGNGYILLEFPHTHLPFSAKETVSNLIFEGMKVVIAHPERNPTIIRNPDVLVDLVEETGAAVQVTGNSITGGFGPAIKACSKYLLKKNIVNIIASDAHSTGFRKPALDEAVKAASKIVGLEQAERMANDNPRSVILGIPLIRRK
jgi:protein-tyrosine phosphatase